MVELERDSLKNRLSLQKDSEATGDRRAAWLRHSITRGKRAKRSGAPIRKGGLFSSITFRTNTVYS